MSTMKKALYILYGEDRFSLQKELEDIKHNVFMGGMADTDITVLDSRQITPSHLINICNTIPFLVSKRLVIVEGLLKNFESENIVTGKRSKKNDNRKSERDGWLLLIEYVKSIPETTALVLVDDEITSKNVLLKELTPLATVKSFHLLKRGELSNWIRSQVKEKEGSISPGAVTMLADYVGGNLGVLASEIDKLVIYTAGRRIDNEDVKSLVSYTRDTSIFTLVDAAMQHQPAQAMLLLQRLFDEGTSPSHVIGMLARQVRLLILAKEFIRQEIATQEAQNRIGILNEYAFRKTMQQARTYSVEQLKYLYRKLLDTDLEMKTGKWKAIKNERWEDELIMDVLITELCSVSLC